MCVCVRQCISMPIQCSNSVQIQQQQIHPHNDRRLGVLEDFGYYISGCYNGQNRICQNGLPHFGSPDDDHPTR